MVKGLVESDRLGATYWNLTPAYTVQPPIVPGGLLPGLASLCAPNHSLSLGSACIKAPTEPSQCDAVLTGMRPRDRKAATLFNSSSGMLAGTTSRAG